ncbi:MAG: DMT family transporter [Alphaproteobacteria bacterium]|nr:DMT family transporter [Alphaproteobacteria bacterium]
MTALGGILAMVASIALFATMDTIVKWLIGNGFSVWQIGFCRGAFSLPAVWWLVVRAGGLHTLKTRRPGLHLWRCLVGMGAMLLFFQALAGMPLADAVALGFSQPFVVTALSVPFLGERVGRHRWAAIVVGFLGVLVILRPGVGVFNPSALLVLGSVLCSAFAILAIRVLSRTESNAAIVLWFSITCTGVCGIAMIGTARWPETALQAALLVAVGILGGFGQFFMTVAYRLAPIATVAPFQYVALPFAILYGWLIWSSWPDVWVGVGTVIIVASGLYILAREARRTQRTPSH